MLRRIEVIWPGFPSALIVSRYTVSHSGYEDPSQSVLASGAKRLLSICLRAARSDCRLHPRLASVCLSAGNLMLCDCLTGRSQLVCFYIPLNSKRSTAETYQVFFQMTTTTAEFNISHRSNNLRNKIVSIYSINL